jgi:hypothetical protein
MGKMDMSGRWCQEGGIEARKALVVLGHIFELNLEEIFGKYASLHSPSQKQCSWLRDLVRFEGYAVVFYVVVVDRVFLLQNEALYELELGHARHS